MWHVFGAELGALARRAWQGAQRRPDTPWAISFLVTGRCVLRCRHCFYHYDASPPADELTPGEYDALSRSLGRFTVALYCGGEPYLRPDLADIVCLMRSRNGARLSSTTTNGQLTDSVVRQTEQILRSAGAEPFLLGISLDGPEAVHDAIRGPGAFAAAMRTWTECRALRRHYPNLVLAATTVVSTLNQAQAPAFVRWAARELEPTSHVVLHARQHPRGGDALTEVSPEQYRATQAEALRAMGRGSLSWARRPDGWYLAAVARHVEQTRRSGARSFHCWAGVHGALVDPVGRLHACEVLAEDPRVPWFGALRDVGMRFGELWRGEAAERVRAEVNHHRACRACTHETMGHAPSLAYPPNWFWRLGAETRAAARAVR